MDLFFISLLLAIYLPLSMGVKCWSCEKLKCEENEVQIVKDCRRQCQHVEYVKNRTTYGVGCTVQEKDEDYCSRIGINGIPLRDCICATDLCNKHRIKCRSCFGNRNQDDPYSSIGFASTAETDFACKKDEEPVVINCPLDAQLCIIKWDNGNKTLGCTHHKISNGQTFNCSGYLGEGECHCNTDECNIDTLSERLMPKPPPATTEKSKSILDKFSKLSTSDLIILGGGVLFGIVMVALCICYCCCICKERKRNRIAIASSPTNINNVQSKQNASDSENQEE